MGMIGFILLYLLLGLRLDVRVLNADQAAEFLGVSKRWLMREGIHERGVPYIRPSPRKTLFYERDLVQMLKSWEVDPNEHELTRRVVTIAQREPGISMRQCWKALKVNRETAYAAMDDAVARRKVRVATLGNGTQRLYPQASRNGRAR